MAPIYNNQNDFLLALEEELKYLKPKEIHEIIKFYRDKINVSLDYGENEAKVIAQLPTPERIAHDIYQTKGIAYLDIRKKQLKRKETFEAVASIFVLLILISLILIISYLYIKSTINLFTLFTNILTFTSLDLIVMIIAICFYFILTLMIYIYIFDLFYQISCYFIIKIIDFLKKDYTKEYRFTKFTIHTSIDKLFKHSKVLLKSLVIVLIITFIALITSFLTKGYIYNSINDKTSNVKTYTLSLEETNNIKDIYINQTNINVTCVKTNSDILEIEYRYLFNNDFNIDYNNNKLDISLTDALTYDLLNIFKEPTPTIIIKIPSLKEYNLNIDATNLKLLLNEANLDIVNINTTEGTFQIYNSIINKLNIKARKGYLDTDITKINQNITNNYLNQIDNSVLEIFTGEINILDYQGSILNINTSTANVDLKNINTLDFTYTSTSGNVNITNLTANNITFTTVATTSVINECYANNLELSLRASSSLNLNKTVIKETINANVSGSYFVTNYLKAKKIKVESNSANLIFKQINVNITKDNLTETQLKYNEEKLTTVMELNNINGTKVSIQNDASTQPESQIENLTIEQEKGSIVIHDALINNLNFNLNNTNIEFKNLYGDNYSVTMKDGYLSYYNDLDKSQKIKINGNVLTQIELGNNIIKEE